MLFFEICKTSGIPIIWETNLFNKCSHATKLAYFYNQEILESSYCSFNIGMLIGAILGKGSSYDEE